jgi:HlyD family secretion protein
VLENTTILDKGYKMKKKTIIIIGSAVVLLVAGLMITQNVITNQAKAKSIELATVKSMVKADIVEATGEFEVHPYAALTWNTSGTVEEIHVQQGDHVQANQELMGLDITSVNSSIISAQATLIQAQQEMDDLLNSDTARADAWIALKDAEDAVTDAENYRKGLDFEQKYQVAKITTKQTPFGTRKVPTLHTYKSMPDDATKAAADDELALAKAKYTDALRAYEKIKNGTNQDDLAIAQSKIDAAQATVNSTKILAPFAGEVLYIDATVGEIVSGGTVSMIIADTDHYYVEALVDEADIALVKEGQSVSITSDGLAGSVLTGSVWSINPVGKNANGLVKFTVQIALDQTENQVLLGSTANVEIKVSSDTERTLVPLTSIKTDALGEYVEVMRDGQITRVNVITGDIEGDQVVVSGDIKVGEQVVISYVSSSMTNLPGFSSSSNK